MELKIALAGNPNSGKTTLFNALTGSNQYVGNWPGVTVEKKEGRYKGDKSVVIQDLPGIYSLSPYTLEEVVARNYLINESPDVILNLVDATNVERNLYLTTQLLELGIPVVIALNMMDVIGKRGDKVDVNMLSQRLGCPIVPISALKGTGIQDAVLKAEAVAKDKKAHTVNHRFSAFVEQAISEISSLFLSTVCEAKRRFYAVKLFERDEKMLELVALNEYKRGQLESIISKCELELDDDSEAILTAERYGFIQEITKRAVKVKHAGTSVSDKIDRVVTNRWLALPIFALVMTFVYTISVSTLGTTLTDWANDGLFGDGWRLFGVGSAQYEEAGGEYETQQAVLVAYIESAQAAGLDISGVEPMLEGEEVEATVLDAFTAQAQIAGVAAELELEGEEGAAGEGMAINHAAFTLALEAEEPDPSAFGLYIPGIPVLIEGLLDAVGCAPWLMSLILDGIVGGVGAVLGFLPQMLILFLMLAFLEDCGYMARIAFIMDRIFRRFGLSGKSFIPMLIGTSCSVPGIMASRTIEQDRDRKMTIMTTTFIPCGAKMPIVALIAGAMFGGAWWVAPSAYFIGMAAVVVSGIILKKTKRFAGDAAPFVMELPAYHMPTVTGVLRSTGERGWSFIKKAGTIIFLASIFVWFTSSFGFSPDGFGMVEEMDNSILAAVGRVIAPLFVPLGFGTWQSAVATVLGLIAKEEVVGAFGTLYSVAGDALDLVDSGAFSELGPIAAHFTSLSAYSFLVFNLLCAPCFAAIGAMKREFNNTGWTWFALAYQTGLAYSAALIVYQLGMWFTGMGFGMGTLVAIALLVGLVFLLVRPAYEEKAQSTISARG